MHIHTDYYYNQLFEKVNKKFHKNSVYVLIIMPAFFGVWHLSFQNTQMSAAGEGSGQNYCRVITVCCLKWVPDSMG